MSAEAVLKGKWCLGCEQVIRRWEWLGQGVPRDVEVLPDGRCRDIHTLEVLSQEPESYACVACGTEVGLEQWNRTEALTLVV